MESFNDIDEIRNGIDSCLDTLSRKLGDKEYLFGNLPTTLDCLLFGYVLNILNPPFPNFIFGDIISKYQNLTHFSNRMLNALKSPRYENKEILEQYIQKNTNKLQKPEDLALTERNSRIYIAFGITTLALYTIYWKLFGKYQEGKTNEAEDFVYYRI